MCYYNGQKVQPAEKIRLLNLEKLIADYNFLDRVIIEGPTYGNHAILKPHSEEEDFDIIQSEWGFIPPEMKTEEELTQFRKGGIDPTNGVMINP